MNDTIGSVPPGKRPQRSKAQRVLSEFDYGQDFSPSYDIGLVRRLWPFMRPHLRLLLVSLLLVPASSGAMLLRPYLTKRTIDAVLVEQDPSLWSLMVLSYAGAVIFEFICHFAQVYSMQLAGQRSIAALRERVYDHAQSMRLSYFDRTPIGRVQTRVTNDVDAVGELFSSGAVMAVADIVMLVGIVSVMLAIDYRLSLLTFAALPPLIIAVEVIRRFARLAFREIRARVAQLNAYLSEQVQGMQVVQAFGREHVSAEEYRIINDAYRRANYRSIKFDAVLYSIVETISTVCVALVIWYASLRAGWVAEGDAAAATAYIGTVVAFYQYIQQFFVPIRDLSTKYTIIQSSLASAERVFGFLDVDETERDDAPSGAVASVSAADRPRDAVVFDGVSFGYKRGDRVLHDVGFRIKQGEHVAIVGATGAGKTSTISLLLRMYEIDEGAIFVDGRDIRDMPLVDLRSMFAVVPQDVFLFAGTVAQNVAMEASYDPARVRSALTRVGAERALRARAGAGSVLDLTVSERGANFSAGERQLLAFARALYRDTPFLILDEATANIDSETEAQLQEAVHELIRGRTSLAIAHRLSTIKQADRILVFHRGRIVEQGTHDELLAQGQVYSHLYALQFADTQN